MILHLVTGNDEARIKNKAKSLASDLSGASDDPFAMEIISSQDSEASEEIIKRFILSYLSPPFFGEKTIWLNHFQNFSQENASSKNPIPTELRNLLEHLKNSPADNIKVIISGPDCDKRKSLYKFFASQGQIHHFDKPEKKNRNWQNDMNRIIKEHAAKKQLSLNHQSLDYIITCIGNDTQKVEPVLETLWCYTGGQGQVTLQQARSILSGNEAADAWVFSNALSKRNLKEALQSVDVLLNREKDPESIVSRLILQASTLFQNFIQAKLLVQNLKIKHPSALESTIKNLNPEELSILKKTFPIASFHPYRLKLIVEDSTRYSNRETLDAVDAINSAVQKLFKSTSSKRIVLESLTHRLISKN